MLAILLVDYTSVSEIPELPPAEIGPSIPLRRGRPYGRSVSVCIAVYKVNVPDPGLFPVYGFGCIVI